MMALWIITLDIIFARYAAKAQEMWLVGNGARTAEQGWRRANDSNTNPTGDYHRTANRDMGRAFDEEVNDDLG